MAIPPSATPIDTVISRHEAWVKAGCDPDKPGRGDLSGRILCDTPFRSVFTGKDLRDAIFTGANLSGADLTETDLRGAELDGAKLSNCDLCDTRFEGANLKKADLTGAKNLTSRRFGGADLERIQFPAGFALDGAGQVDEWLKGANSLYLLYLSLCIFSVIVAYSTSEVQIVTETGTAKLPLIDIQLPILWFFFLAPGLISIVYLVFRLNLLRACEGMAELPAIYEDGQTVHKKVHPVIINGIFLSRLRRLENKHPELYTYQTLITTFTVFVVPHLALLAIWGRFLLRQQWEGSLFHVGVYFFTATVGLRYGMENEKWILRKVTSVIKESKEWYAIVAFMFLLLYLTFGSLGYLNFGKVDDGFPFTQNESPANTVLAWFRLHPEARVDGEEISTGKPTNWKDTLEENSNKKTTLPVEWEMVSNMGQRDAKNTNKPLTLIVRPSNSTTESRDIQWAALVAPVRGAKLSNMRLRRIRATGAFLVKADLSNANLEHADLSCALLHSTDLSHTILHKSFLSDAQLLDANLSWANLSDAILWGANLSGANLSDADLTRAKLQHADLSDADLTRADLLGADLSFANLSHADLTRADLSGADLSGADLSGADLSGTLEIRGAIITGAKYYRGKGGQNGTKWPARFDPVKAGAIEVDEKRNKIHKN